MLLNSEQAGLPKASIITVAYNAESGIREALESAVGQSYANKEIIVIDGGSSDGTMDIVNGFRNEIAVCISEEDDGIPDALNKGIAHASGDWLYFLNSDDVFADDRVLERLFRTPPQADLLYGNVILKSSGRKYDGSFTIQKLMAANICHQAQFYHRRIFDRVGLFDVRYKLLSDYEHTLRIFSAPGLTIRYVDEVIAVFNDRGRTSYLFDRPFFENRLEIFDRRFRGILKKRERAVYLERYLYYFFRNGQWRPGMLVLAELLIRTGRLSWVKAAWQNYRSRHAVA